MAAKRIPADRICLLANTYSAMRAREDTMWDNVTHTGRTNIELIPSRADITPREYVAAFNNIAGRTNIEGVIVSADPIFKKSGGPLVAASNGWLSSSASHKHVCFSMHDFRDHGPARGKSSVHGPKFEEAFRLLGERTSEVVRAPNATGVMRDAVERPDDITTFSQFIYAFRVWLEAWWPPAGSRRA
jgi:hypothetical protein